MIEKITNQKFLEEIENAIAQYGFFSMGVRGVCHYTIGHNKKK